MALSMYFCVVCCDLSKIQVSFILEREEGMWLVATNSLVLESFVLAIVHVG